MRPVVAAASMSRHDVRRVYTGLSPAGLRFPRRVYEGLVAYGADGKVEPALATSWTTATTADGGEEFRFTLREGVTFHDGAAWNCAVAKLNFDHFFVPALTGPGWHGWYGLPGALDSWTCDGEVFVVKTKTSYYPLLQELTSLAARRDESRRRRGRRAEARRGDAAAATRRFGRDRRAPQVHSPDAHALAELVRRRHHLGPAHAELVARPRRKRAGSAAARRRRADASPRPHRAAARRRRLVS